MSIHAFAYAALSITAAFRKMIVVLEKVASATEQLGVSLAIGEAYEPSVIADFERDSGGSIEEIERFEESLGVKW